MSASLRRSALPLLLFTAATALPWSASAHKQWLAPSKTTLNVGQWITVDAGSSTDPFLRDHRPARLDNLVITAPDGRTVEAQNASTGALRSSFDLKLDQTGTYRIAIAHHGISARWEEDGQRKAWPPRGEPFTAEGFAKAVPATAEKLSVTESLSQLVTFASAGKPNHTALRPAGRGLELAPLSHPTDLYVNEPARFRFLLDGKPAAGLSVEVIADGVRYRSAVEAQELQTDAEGIVTIEWARPGLHWISASVTDDKVSAPPATQRRTAYTAVMDVLSP